MAISDYQMRTVIRTYMKIMKGRIVESGAGPGNSSELKDEITISHDALKKMMSDRVEKHIAEKLKNKGPR